MKKIILLLLFPIFNFAQIQIGQDIDAEAEFDFFGFTTSVSSDGKMEAIWAPFNDGNGTHSGHVRVFENQGGTWVQVGADIDGEAEGDLSGHSVSLSSDGSVVVIGARNNEGTGQDASHVRVFGLSEFISSTVTPKAISFAVFPNPAFEQITIQLQEGNIFEQVTIYNCLGQRVKTSTNTILNISNLSQGIYFIEVDTSEGIASQKITVL